MIKPLPLIALITLIFTFSNVNAQLDTSKLDLGRLILDKNFTQTVTVKGTDLEKMPFINLEDAINVWFYGSYTNAVNNIYVVDGNLLSDVNIYSVYDIDEVTLVQTSLTRIAGAVQQQHLILVKTKRAKDKGYGITANAQAALSTNYTNNIVSGPSPTSYQTGVKSNKALYQQYYLSGYYNTGDIQAGISADLLHNAFPNFITTHSPNYTHPESLNLYRLNGYFSAKLGNSVLDIKAGYAPESDGLSYSYNSSGGSSNNNISYTHNYEHQHMLNAEVKFTTRISPNLTNVAHAAYNNNQSDYESTSWSGDTLSSIATQQHKNHGMVAYDNLSYNYKFGNWALQPMVNLEFRSINDSVKYYNAFHYNYSTIIPINAGSSYKVHTFLLTPSVNLYYKRYFNLQVGLLDNLSTIGFFKVDSNKKVFPFASVSFDPVQLIKPGFPLSVKLYGSYSLSYFWLDDYNALTNFSSSTLDVPVLSNGTYNEVNKAYFQPGSNTDYRNFYQALNTGSKSFKNISAGIEISPLKTGLSFDYYYQRGTYLSPIEVYVTTYNTNYFMEVYNNTKEQLHRFGVSYTLTAPEFHFQTGLNATMLEREYPVNYGQTPRFGANEWTGGWVNRLECHNFFAGLDVLYRLGEAIYYVSSPNFSVESARITSISLQNVYVGYKFKIAGKGTEIYANGRNLLQAKETDITDNRRYLGIGLKVSL